MPIPKPNPGEERDTFVSRCMSNDLMKNEYPNNDQRSAVCLTSWENSKEDQKDNEEYEVKHILVALDVKEADSNTGHIEGYASIFNNIDQGLDVILPGAFTKSIEKLDKAGNTLPMFFRHNLEEPVGEWYSFKEDEQGLYVKGQFFIEEMQITEGVRKARNIALSKMPKGLSIGYIPTKRPKFVTKAGRRIRELSELDLVETSITPFPMNTKAIITEAKDTNGELVKESIIEDSLRKYFCLSHTEAKAFMAGGYSRLREAVENKSNSHQREAENANAQLEMLEIASKLTSLTMSIKGSKS